MPELDGLVASPKRCVHRGAVVARYRVRSSLALDSTSLSDRVKARFGGNSRTTMFVRTSEGLGYFADGLSPTTQSSASAASMEQLESHLSVRTPGVCGLIV